MTNKGENLMITQYLLDKTKRIFHLTCRGDVFGALWLSLEIGCDLVKHSFLLALNGYRRLEEHRPHLGKAVFSLPSFFLMTIFCPLLLADPHFQGNRTSLRLCLITGIVGTVLCILAILPPENRETIFSSVKSWFGTPKGKDKE
jgi:hypothetical protein